MEETTADPYKETKEWLNKYRLNEHRIEKLTNSVEFWRCQAEKTTAGASSGGGGGGGDSMARATENALVQEDALQKSKAAAPGLLYALELVIVKVRNDEQPLQELLASRYVQGRTWSLVAFDIGYSLRQTHRLHRLALAAAKDVIPWHTPSVI